MNEKDRRVKRTRRRIEDAFLSILQEKDYERITIQEILDRADVGRATFYAHYKDKEELAVSRFLEMLETMGLPEPSLSAPRLMPVKELFEHVIEMKTLKKFAFTGSGMSMYLEYGRRFWSKKLVGQIAYYKKHRLLPELPEDLAAATAINLLMTMFAWWLRAVHQPSPAKMDKWYHGFLFTK